nr:MAG: putative RNA-dependent RNA polymerase [Mitoviridae sp.]
MFNKKLNNQLKAVLTTRRIKGLFASILENGSMISLAGTWKIWNPKLGPVPKGFEVRYEPKPDSTPDNPKGLTWYRLPGLADLVRGFGWRVLSFCFPGRVRFTRRLRQLYRFSNYIYRIYKVSGPVQAVKYLKAAQLAVQKSIGKDKIESLRDIDPDLLRTKVTGYGLPIFIPSRDRKLIAAGSPTIIRWWLTLFSVYRVIAIPGVLKLQTITQASTVSIDKMEGLVSSFTEFLSSGSMTTMFDLKILKREAEIQLLETASATHKVAWQGIFSDPYILSALGQADNIRIVLKLFGQSKLLLFFESLVEMHPNKGAPISYEGILGEGAYAKATVLEPKGRFVGKLAIKEEAAGKMRVFALVDVWTQSVLKPLHDMLFTFLKSLPNDGTFDQHKSELRAREKAANAGYSYGYDLSAATDRLPLVLQVAIMDLLMPGLGKPWSELLTSRAYFLILPDDFQKGIKKLASKGKPVPVTYKIGDTEYFIRYTTEGKAWISLRYAVGQPMGALSSWAMLAVTHHFIVQLAYRKAYSIDSSIPFNQCWFEGYELLGDDIIIFDHLVAKEYLVLMDGYGVPINTTKSVCATVPVTEFAKVTSYRGLNVSALSWKMFMSGNSLMGRANIVYALLSRGIVTRNINPWIVRSTAINPWKPGLNSPTYIALWTMLANKGMITIENALRALIDGKSKVFRFAKAILLNADVPKIQRALPGLILGKGLNLFESKSVAAIFNIELPWFKIAMWKPLAVFRARANVEGDVAVLSREIFKHAVHAFDVNGDLSQLDKYCTLVLETGSFFAEGAPVLPTAQNAPLDYHMPDDFTVSMQVLYASLYSILLEKANRLAEPILSRLESVEMDSPTERLVRLNDKLERYNEFFLLPGRADIKLSTDPQPPARVVRPTELKLIKLISKMSDRPAFTTALNL